MQFWKKTGKTFRGPGWLIRAMDALMVLLAISAVSALVIQYGMRWSEGPMSKHWLYRSLDIIEAIIVGLFVLDRFIRVGLSRRPLMYLRNNWVDFTLIFLAGVVMLVGSRYEDIISIGALYIITIHVYLVAAIVLNFVSVNRRFAESGIPPAWLLIGGFVFLCLAGSLLLYLPAAVQSNYQNWHYPDALFTAVSATCVTGLIVVDTGSHFTPFGQGVILVLIQLGGLGIMLFGTVLAMIFGRGMSVRHANTLGQAFGTREVGRIGKVAFFVVFITVLFELAGAVLLYPMFSSSPGIDGGIADQAGAIWNSIFHSISAFCNAGFSLFDRGLMAGVGSWSNPLRGDWRILGVFAPLIVLGGIGFPVLQDVWQYIRAWTGRGIRRLGRNGLKSVVKAERPVLTLHSRLVLTTTLLLILTGALVLLIVMPMKQEGPQLAKNSINWGAEKQVPDWLQMEPSERVGAAVFQSVSARTAGFNTIEMSSLTDAGKLWMCFLMIIGGSPAGTAGGMKTVTLALLLLTVWSVLKRRNQVEAYHRTVSGELVRRFATFAFLYLSFVMLVTMLMCITMPGHAFIDLLFETCSACGTVGLSTGITDKLTIPAQYIITIAMFFGRIGPLTLLLAITAKIKYVDYSYPQEDVLIG